MSEARLTPRALRSPFMIDDPMTVMSDVTSTNPSETAHCGDRDPRSGRCAAGNRAAVGHAKRQAKLRALFFDCVTEDDFRQVVAALVREAKTGDPAAIRELLLRLLGRPDDGEHAER